MGSIAIQVSEIRFVRYFCIDIGIELASINCIAYRYQISLNCCFKVGLLLLQKYQRYFFFKKFQTAHFKQTHLESANRAKYYECVLFFFQT